MTGHALLRRALVAIVEVAGEARRILVLVSQRECRLVVIEVDSSPGDAVVTASAIAPELAFMRFLIAMTRVAIGRRFAEALPFHVAAVAGHGSMPPLQREVGAGVIELIAAELDDVSVATEVLGMASLALERGGCTGQPSVEAALRADISSDVFVARQAELRLPTSIATVMAVRAVLFELRMRTGELAWHE
jgi:hypothetical protein